MEDDSEFRRGKSCLHKVAGIDVAVNAGNFMYFLPLRVLHVQLLLRQDDSSRN